MHSAPCVTGAGQRQLIAGPYAIKCLQYEKRHEIQEMKLCGQAIESRYFLHEKNAPAARAAAPARARGPVDSRAAAGGRGGAVGRGSARGGARAGPGGPLERGHENIL